MHQRIFKELVALLAIADAGVCGGGFGHGIGGQSSINPLAFNRPKNEEPAQEKRVPSRMQDLSRNLQPTRSPDNLFD